MIDIGNPTEVPDKLYIVKDDRRKAETKKIETITGENFQYFKNLPKKFFPN